MSKGASLVKNTIILGFGTLSTQLIGFVLLPIYTRYLSPDEYGLVDVAIVLLSLLVPSLTIQLNMASFRFLVDARGDREQQTRVISNIALMVVLLTVPWVLIFTALGFIFEIPYFGFIVATGISLLFSQQTLQITRGLGSNMQFAVASIIASLFTLIGAFVFIVWLGLRVEGMLLSICMANLASSFYLTFKMKLYRYLRVGKKDNSLRREIVGYSAPLIPNGLAWWANNAANRVLIAIMIGTAANGVYAVSTKFSSILNSLFSVFSMSWTESATTHIDEPDRDEFFSFVANSAVRLFGAMGLGLIAVMPFIFPVMVDSAFSDAYLYIPILVVGIFFNVLVGIYSAVYIAKKLTVKVMNTTIIAAVLNIVMTLSLTPVLGLFGAASGTSLTFLALAIIRHFDVRKYVTITYERSVFAELLISCLVILFFYYLNVFWMNVAGLTIAALAALLINRNQVGILWVLLKGRAKTLF